MGFMLKGEDTSVKVKVSLSCPTLWNPMDYTVHGILQARILKWVAFSFRGSSQPRDRTQVSRTVGRFFTSWATRVRMQMHCFPSTQSPPAFPDCDRYLPHDLHTQPQHQAKGTGSLSHFLADLSWDGLKNRNHSAQWADYWQAPCGWEVGKQPLTPQAAPRSGG